LETKLIQVIEPDTADFSVIFGFLWKWVKNRHFIPELMIWWLLKLCHWPQPFKVSRIKRKTGTEFNAEGVLWMWHGLGMCVSGNASHCL